MRAGTTTLFDVPVRQATKASGIDASESIPVLHKRLLIRVLVRDRYYSAVPEVKLLIRVGTPARSSWWFTHLKYFLHFKGTV